MSRQKFYSLTPQHKDIREDKFRCGGKGGQKQNKTESGSRFTHLPSGAVGECREERSWNTNRKRAWRRMGESNKFKMWVKLFTAKLDGLDDRIENSMKETNIKIEYKEDGKWVDENERI